MSRLAEARITCTVGDVTAIYESDITPARPGHGAGYRNGTWKCYNRQGKPVRCDSAVNLALVLGRRGLMDYNYRNHLPCRTGTTAEQYKEDLAVFHKEYAEVKV